MLVRWTQGNDHGLVWEHGLAVLSGTVAPDAARRLWTELAEGGDLAAFLKALGYRMDKRPPLPAESAPPVAEASAWAGSPGRDTLRRPPRAR